MIYQWAATEDIIDFLKQDGKIDEDIDAMHEHLTDTYQLEIEREYLADIILFRSNYA